MANKYRGEVKIVLDKERTIRFTNNNLAEAEAVLGFPIPELANHLGIIPVRTALFFGLKHEDKSITMEEVGDLMDEAESFSYLCECIFKAITLAMGGRKPEQKN